jgi:hypothetical protein
MKACSFMLFALGVAGCQSRAASDPSATPPPGTAGFPIGTYTNCARGVRNPSGNIFVNSAGFESDAILTLTQSGTTVTSTYDDQNRVTQTLRFSTTSGTSATVTQTGQVIPGFVGLCIMGPRNEIAYPATMNIRAGALIYDAGMVFIALTGGLEADAGTCGKLSEPVASSWLLCEHRQEGALRSTDAGSPAVTPLPAGQYSCKSQVEILAHVDGTNQFITGGGSGTLALSQDGASVSAQYSGDSSLAGTLRMSVTTSTTANAEAGQTLMTPCVVPTRSQTPEPLSIAAGALAISDSTLFLSFAGTMAASSSCPDAQVAGSVICSK